MDVETQPKMKRCSSVQQQKKTSYIRNMLEAHQSLVVLVIQDPQNSQEQIQNIQIQRNGCGNLLLDMTMPDDQLRIHKDVRRENKRPDSTIHQLNGAILREERSHETKQDKEPQTAEQVRHPVGEVVFRLAREERQRDEHAQRQDERLHDNARVIERGHHADGVGFHHREPGQEKEIGRVGFALPVGDQHHAQGANDGKYEEPEVRADP